ncbi:cysteine desulfurase [Rhodobacter sp. TJ_12]|uniref:urate hydroxylase PuuD n=1 Tax=Rhodobacter sp. TJ_12 TaxID=2029399 RepID=UPI001CBBCB5C|nr:urate hydroxylase PuuD [Rhodobacter sp. TJ_12]MBZ4021620.1 cysteine desulfurase [Rhodobacter sp. TJ_12]
MLDTALLWDWASFAMRWFHIITVIAWIGSSFYFIALDLGLRKAPDLPPGAAGEEWQVHGGGFYHIQKYLVAPARLPEHLIWFKWESYATWLSGAAMLMLVYWYRADLFLIDPLKLDLAPWQAMAISAGSLTIGWLIYDAACKSKLGHYPAAFMGVLLAALAAMAWGYAQVFTDRAAFLHLGAYTATIMTANVFLVIIPNQKIVVADLKAGRTPDPEFGRIAKLRSMHNNYLTLPVIFFMLSNHYPLSFAGPWNWVIATLVFLMGITIRHWFNTRHAGKGSPYWTIPVTLLLFAACVWLSTLRETPVEEETALTPMGQHFAAAEGFEDVADLVSAHCAMCHMPEPAWAGFASAPRGLVLDTPAAIANQAEQVYIFAGLTDAMPPGSANFMEPEDRAAIRDWFRAAQAGRLAQN